MTILLKLKELDRIEKLNAIQDEAVNALKKDNYVGTLKLATGVGKSMTSLKAIHGLPFVPTNVHMFILNNLN